VTDPARRSALLGVKLGALVRDHLGEGSSHPGVFAGGAALVRDGEAWVLADEQPARALGPALAWARQQGASALHLLAEEAAGTLARRAAAFDHPVEVLQVDGRVLRPAEPTPLPAPAAVDPAFVALVELIVEGGAQPVVEHGVVAGEVRGLEVCRVVRDAHLGVVRLEVGVGAADREAFQLLHGDVPPVEALRAIVARVDAVRRPGAEPHPLNRLGAERLLRWRLEQEPSLVGAAELHPAQPPLPRSNLSDAVPCVAEGADPDGGAVLVVCSVGIDLDLVPYAADARLRAPAGARLVLAVPERDRHPVTLALAAMLRTPADVVGVAG
jgi:hypothetical protein